MRCDLEIRLAGPEDFAGTGKLLGILAADLADDEVVFREQSLRSAFDGMSSQERGAIVLALIAGTPIGMITVSFNLSLRHAGEYAQIEELVVDPLRRGKRIGSKLIETAVAIAKDRGCAEVGLYAVERNRPFYEKMGFSYVGPENAASSELAT